MLSKTQRPRRAQNGFSLLEITIALSVSGVLLSGIWQLTAASGMQREAAGLSSQAMLMTAASKDYISAQSTALLALPALASLDAVARVKITDADTGEAFTSVQGAGYLPQGFVNENSYGQRYALFVKREDAGTPGVADNGDRLIGLLLTTGGTAISDQMGSRISGSMGAPGGFLFADSNPADPAAATTARGAAGGWQIDLTSTGWSSIGSVAQAGRIAALVNLIPSGMGVGGGGGGGASKIDDLSDGVANYTNGNVFLGENSGNTSMTGQGNIGVGINVLPNAATTSGNTAIGYNTLSTTNTLRGFTAVGFEAIRYSYVGGTVGHMSYNTAVGYQALRGSTDPTWNYGSSNTAIGHGALLNAYVASSNVAIGAAALGRNGPLGASGNGYNNVAIGAANGTSAGALGANTSGSNNVAVGQAAGANITTGSNNIMVGAATAAASATADNQLNIGNRIYGDLSTGQIRIGNATLTTGIGFDDGVNTSASRLAVGTVAQRPVCTGSLEGAERYNSQTQTKELCVGGAWMQPSPAWVPANGTPPTPNPSSGYFVLTASSWDGNLGGPTGANSKCLTELTSKDWMGKADAITRNLLTASKVVAFICPFGLSDCNNASSLTTYYFAVADSPVTGGANFTTDISGRGPNNSYAWSAFNYFGISATYWSNRRSSSSTAWGTSGESQYSGACASNFTTAIAGNNAVVGNTSSSGSGRWINTYEGCNTFHRLICIVNP